MTPTRRYVERSLADTGVIELRHQLGKQWATGWFDNADALLWHAWDLRTSGNLFTSINRPAPRIVSNRMTGTPIRNEEVQFLTRLFFDFDPERPTGCASTEEELQHAVKSAQSCAAVLRAMSWPDPLTAISGNGAHLLYRCHLPNTEEIRQQLNALYSGMREDYSTDFVDFDRAVRNAGRICALYGTTKRKGENTPGRPHRKSQVLTWPRNWQQVSRRNFDALANMYARHSVRIQQAAPPTGTPDRISGSGDFSTLDVVAWFAAHGLYEHHIKDEIHAVGCPWENEHTESNKDDTIIFANDDGSWPGFHCKHSHCAGRTIRDVMQVLGDADAFCAQVWGDKKNET